MFDSKFQVFQKLAKMTSFGIFDELLSTQNVKVTRFASNVDCDFFSVIFKHRENWGISNFFSENVLKLAFFNVLKIQLGKRKIKFLMLFE